MAPLKTTFQAAFLSLLIPLPVIAQLSVFEVGIAEIVATNGYYYWGVIAPENGLNCDLVSEPHATNMTTYPVQPFNATCSNGKELEFIPDGNDTLWQFWFGETQGGECHSTPARALGCESGPDVYSSIESFLLCWYFEAVSPFC